MDQFPKQKLLRSGWILKQLKDMQEIDPTVSNCGSIKDILHAIENGELE